MQRENFDQEIEKNFGIGKLSKKRSKKHMQRSICWLKPKVEKVGGQGEKKESKGT